MDPFQFSPSLPISKNIKIIIFKGIFLFFILGTFNHVILAQETSTPLTLIKYKYNKALSKIGSGFFSCFSCGSEQSKLKLEKMVSLIEALEDELYLDNLEKGNSKSETLKSFTTDFVESYNSLQVSPDTQLKLNDQLTNYFIEYFKLTLPNLFNSSEFLAEFERNKGINYKHFLNYLSQLALKKSPLLQLPLKTYLKKLTPNQRDFIASLNNPELKFDWLKSALSVYLDTRQIGFFSGQPTQLSQSQIECENDLPGSVSILDSASQDDDLETPINFSCISCGEEMPHLKLYQPLLCDCKKNQLTTCTDCVKKFHQLKLKEGSISENCFCGSPHWDYNQIENQNILSPSELKLIQTKLLKLKINKTQGKNFNLCTANACPFALDLNSTLHQQFKIYSIFNSSLCPFCASPLQKCEECLNSNHVGESCDSLETSQKLILEKFATFPCPKCQYYLSREGGCVHLDCPQCHTAVSSITQLPMPSKKSQNKGDDAHQSDQLEYDIAGWPIKYFYPGGVYELDKRQDQLGRLIDSWGNLWRIVDKKLLVEVDYGRHGIKKEFRTIQTRVNVDESGKNFFLYDPSTDTAQRLNPNNNYEPIKFVPNEEFYQFKGKWDQILIKIKIKKDSKKH
jgi:hypothetical protein